MGPANYVTDLYVVVCVTFPFTFVAGLGRFMARRMLKVKWWWDDYFSLVAFLASVVWNILVLFWIQQGIGRHLTDITWLSQDEALRQSKIMLYFIELTYAVALAMAKLAVLSFYWRLFKTSSIRIPIQLLFVASCIWLIIRIPMTIFHCVPVYSFWEANVPGAYCAIDNGKFFIGTTMTHFFLDIFILVLPVTEVSKLHMKKGKKFGVAALFLFGIFVCIGSVCLVNEAFKFNVTDIQLPYNIAPIIIWATVEVNFAVVSACLPTLRPVLRVLCCCLPATSTFDNSTPHHNPSGGTRVTGTQHTSKGIKMSVIHHRNKEDEADEGDSTYRLADSVERGSDAGDFDRHAVDSVAVGAVPVRSELRTVITGRNDASDAAIAGARSPSPGEEASRDIMVHSEIIRSVEPAGRRSEIISGKR